MFVFCEEGENFPRQQLSELTACSTGHSSTAHLLPQFIDYLDPNNRLDDTFCVWTCILCPSVLRPTFLSLTVRIALVLMSSSLHEPDLIFFFSPSCHVVTCCTRILGTQVSYGSACKCRYQSILSLDRYNKSHL